MRSLRIIIFGIAVAIVSITVEAQHKTLLQTEVMAKQLDLDAKQKAELDKHFKSMKSEREATQVKMKSQREEAQRDQFVKREAQTAKLKSILTEEQFAKVQEQRKNSKKNRVRKGQQRGTKGNRGVQQSGQRRKDASIQKGQRGQRKQNGQQGQMRQRGDRSEMARDPEMRKKFQEFLELEKQKEKNGGGKLIWFVVAVE